MKHWRNPDLLVPDEVRTRLEAEFPGMLGPFDWPELRKLFEGFDVSANAARQRRRRVVLLAVSAAGTGALLAAVLPLIELAGTAVARWTFAVAALLSLVGLAWAIGLQLVDRRKAEWLEHRLRTERTRQFYFQFMLSNPDLAAAAFHDGKALEEWKAHRRTAFTALEAWLKLPMEAELRRVIADVNLTGVWQMSSWATRPRINLRAAQLESYFRILKRQRIDIQLDYIREKFGGGLRSPEKQLQAIGIASWILTILAVLFGVAGAATLFFGGSIESASFRGFVSATATVGVLSIFLRVLSEGLQLREDVDRYRWYRKAIEAVDASYNDPAPAARLRALRELERITYREMREFLLAQQESKFTFS